jgi:hypothetical protein
MAGSFIELVIPAIHFQKSSSLSLQMDISQDHYRGHFVKKTKRFQQLDELLDEVSSKPCLNCLKPIGPLKQ